MKETIPRHSLINTLDQFWDIAKILETCYFRYFGNDWPCPPELTVSTCTKAWCLYACKTSALSIHPFFLEILQRYCKLIYFGWFGYAWLWSSKRMVSACKNLHAKNQIDPSRLSWNTANYIADLFFWVLWTYLATLTKKQEILILYAKNQLHSFPLLRDIAKILQPCYFGYFRHAWLNELAENFDVYFHAKK